MATTADEVWQLLGELVQAQKETERLLNEQRQEAERSRQEADRRFQKQREEDDRRFKKTDRQIQELGKQIGGL
ncbi:MAG: DUF3782 domain-containing protein, partial [Synechocystis sp.]